MQTRNLKICLVFIWSDSLYNNYEVTQQLQFCITQISTENKTKSFLTDAVSASECCTYIFNILISTEILWHNQHMLYVSFNNMISVKSRYNRANSWNLLVLVLSPITYIWSCVTLILWKKSEFLLGGGL